MNAVVEVATVEVVAHSLKVVVCASVGDYRPSMVPAEAVTSTSVFLRHSIDRGAPNALSTIGVLAVA